MRGAGLGRINAGARACVAERLCVLRFTRVGADRPVCRAIAAAEAGVSIPGDDQPQCGGVCAAASDAAEIELNCLKKPAAS